MNKKLKPKPLSFLCHLIVEVLLCLDLFAEVLVQLTGRNVQLLPHSLLQRANILHLSLQCLLHVVLHQVDSLQLRI